MNTIDLSYWDILSLLGYLLLLFAIGYRSAKRTDKSSQNDFLLGNRSLSLPAFVATLVTTWYGGILGIGEFTYLYGISTWIIFGLPYYIFAAIFAFLIAGKVRSAGQFTIADIFYDRHDRRVGILAGIFLLFMTSPAPYILMIALLLELILGWSFFLSLIAGSIFSTLYVFFGGFRSVVQTDKLQFVLIYGGFFILLYFLVDQYGGAGFITNQLPPDHLSPSGGNSIQYILVWFFLASWTFIDPGFHQRCSAAKSLQTARRGILISILFWFVFDFLTISCGLYAAVILKDINPLFSFPLLADQVLPPFIKGIFFTALFAVIMSTIDSFTFLSAITFGRDLVWRSKRTKNETLINRYTRLGLILTAIVSVVLCLLFPSVIQLWYVIGSLFIPPMLLPLLSAYFPNLKLPAKHILQVMIASFSVSLFSFLWGQIQITGELPSYPLGIEPFFPGFILSIILFLGFKLKIYYSNRQ
jgi:solute:Na+ symporter, SSS family